MKIFKKVKDGGARRFYFCGIKIYSYKKNIPQCRIDPTASIDANSVIGEYTFIGKDVDITKTSIGRYCSIAPHVRIGMGEHAIDKISTSSYLEECHYKDLTKKDCIIKNNVWIGTEAIIRRGVTIGNCAVIGANSFVNKDVPDFAVVAGSPARIIKYRFDPCLRKKILKSAYWKYDPDKAKKIITKIM